MSDHAVVPNADLTAAPSSPVAASVDPSSQHEQPEAAIGLGAANGRVDALHRAPLAPVAPTTGARRWARAAKLTLGIDVAALVAANVISLTVGFGASSWLLLAFDVGAIALLATWRSYSPRIRLDMLDDIRTIVTSTAVATMVVITIDTLFSPSEPDASGALQLWFVASALLAAGRFGLTSVVMWQRRYASGTATTIVVGAGNVGQLAARRLLDHPELGLRPIGFLDAEPLAIDGKPLPLPVLGSSDDLEHVIATKGIDCAVVAFSSDSHDALLELLDECNRLGVRALVVPRLFERVPSRIEVAHVGGLPLLEMRATSPRSVQFAIKYALDRVVALVLLVLLTPLLAVIASAVAISLGRPILYRQDRVSLDGNRFRMLKFRTMKFPIEDEEDAHDFDPALAPGGIEGSDRRTRVGTWLRRWSIDELPQLLNVLKGEMSLVGPRPERPEYVEYFREHVRRYDGRLRTKAGITGWAQIHRLRGRTSIADRVEWDNYYIENFSIWLDLKILFFTIPETLKGRAN